jgi:hypothetical protein
MGDFRPFGDKKIWRLVHGLVHGHGKVVYMGVVLLSFFSIDLC